MHKSLLLFHKSRILNCFTVIGESHVSACYLGAMRWGCQCSLCSFLLSFHLFYVTFSILKIFNGICNNYGSNKKEES